VVADRGNKQFIGRRNHLRRSLSRSRPQSNDCQALFKDNEYRVGIVLSTVPDSDCVAESFLSQHYTSNSEAAANLAAYLKGQDRASVESQRRRGAMS
jgi:hypothetical protein